MHHHFDLDRALLTFERAAHEATVTGQAVGVLAWRHELPPDRAKLLLEVLAAADGLSLPDAASHILREAVIQ